jgi:hypothetical protein
MVTSGLTMPPFPRAFARATSGLLAALLISLASTPASADVPVSEKARAHFNAGVNLLQDPDGARYEEAYREFKAAYADSPSWKMLGNLALAAMKLERDGEAIDAYTKYLAEGGSELDAEERAQVERDLATLTAGVVRIEIEASPAGAILIDERAPVHEQPVKNAYDAADGRFSLGVRAGHHRFTARLAGYQDATWEVDARPGANLSHRLELVPVTSASPATEGPTTSPAASSSWNTQKTVAAVVGGVGVVGVVAGTVFFFNYKSKNDDAKDVCPSGSDCPPGSADRHADLIDDARSARTLTYVGWGVGAAALAGAAALYFTAPKTEAPPTAARARTLNFVPAVAPGHFGAELSGSF